MKIHFYLILTLAIVGCKPSPNYNPFDEKFDISIRDVIKNGCDTIPAGCGYYNLQVRNGKLRPFYQIYDEDFYDVVGKGFTYYADSFDVIGLTNENRDGLLDSLLNQPFDSEKFEEEISKYDYHFFEKSGQLIKIINPNLGDTILLGLDIYYFEDENGDVAVREIDYLNIKKN